nr:hypothetical protein [Angustibacter aerolatus]
MVRLRSTGTKGSQSRTLTASLAPNGFLNYIYHTNFETLDPLLFTGNGDARRSTCAQYWYKGRPDSGNGACTDIGFGGGDVINGPIHTNDSILMNGVATFANAQTETSLERGALDHRPHAAERHHAVPQQPGAQRQQAVLRAGAADPGRQHLAEGHRRPDEPGVQPAGLRLHRCHPHHVHRQHHDRVQPEHQGLDRAAALLQRERRRQDRPADRPGHPAGHLRRHALGEPAATRVVRS